MIPSILFLSSVLNKLLVKTHKKKTKKKHVFVESDQYYLV